MKTPEQIVRIEGRIEMHLSADYTKIKLFIGGSRMVEVKTENIPVHLRALGTKVLITFKSGTRFGTAKDDDIQHYEELIVSDLPENPQLGWFNADDAVK